MQRNSQPPRNTHHSFGQLRQMLKRLAKGRNTRMKERAAIFLPILALSGVVCGALVRAQAPKPAAEQAVEAKPAQGRVLGEVTSIDTAARQLTLKTMDGQQANVRYDEQTVFRRVPAGETTLDKAIAITASQLELGDRVIARGSKSGDAFIARSIVVVSQADIAQKKQREREKWKQRGVAGIVTAINADTKEITISLRSQPATGLLIISAGGAVHFRRFAPDSIRFSDSINSTFAAVKIGDQLRALGKMSSDGGHFVAEEIVSAAFRIVGGKITSINAQVGEITINDIQTQKPLIIILSKDSMMRRLTPDLLKMLEQQSTPGATPARAPAGEVGASVQEMIENLPPLVITDLKLGDGVLVSSIKEADLTRATAVMLAAGVESYLKKQEKQATRPGFTLDLVLPGAF
jgi:hypothetical protein